MLDPETMPVWFRPRWDATNATWDINNWDVFRSEHESKPKQYVTTVPMEALDVFGLHELSYSQLINIWQTCCDQHRSRGERFERVPPIHIAEFFLRAV